MAEFKIDKIIQIAKELGIFHQIDILFADFLMELEGQSEHSKYLYLAVLFVSSATNSKHTCLDLKSIAGVNLYDLVNDEKTITDDPPVMLMPNYKIWIEHIMQASKTVVLEKFADDDVSKHIVLTDDGFLYLHKYWKYEQIVVDAINCRKKCKSSLSVSRADLKPAFANMQNTEWQEIAVLLALRQQISVITGGPGTGKTTTVATALALLPKEEQYISMVAPTGKAAQRLKESIGATKKRNSFFANIPEDTETIHRFLGYNPRTRSYKYNVENKRPTDVLIVDEASMVSLSLFAKLVEAVKTSCKIILLGDKDQLAAVETGNVLSELTNVDDINSFSSNTVKFLNDLKFENISENNQQNFIDIIVKLVYSHRFNDQSAIGVLSKLVNDAETEEDLQKIENVFSHSFDVGEISNIEVNEDNFYPALKKSVQPFIKAYKKSLKHYEHVVETENQEVVHSAIEDVLNQIDECKILCAYRKNEVFGVDAVNNYIEKIFFSQSFATFYNGKVIMIIKNDRLLGLANGDIGVILQDEDNVNHTYFKSVKSESLVRSIPVSALPEYESAFAVTIHKSQGSEYKNIIMILGDEISKLLTKELVYTGITRAKESVEIFAGKETLAKAAICKTKRSSRIQKFL